MNRLTRIEVRGFKSLRDLTLDDIGGMTVLIGANGSGKSNVVSFFSLLNWMMSGTMRAYVARKGGASALLHYGPKTTPQLETTLSFQTENGLNTYRARLAHASPDMLIFLDEAVSYRSPGFASPLVLPLGVGHAESRVTRDHEHQTVRHLGRLLARCRVFQFHDTSDESPVRLSRDLNDNRFLRSDAGNLASYLYALGQGFPGHYHRIVETIRQVFPQFQDFDLAPDRLQPNSIRLAWRERGSDYLFGPHQLSDGTLRAMALITLLLQPEDDLPDILIVDEPELGLHPFAIGVLASLLRGVAAAGRQVLVATQSPLLVDHFEPQDIVVVERPDRETTLRRLSAAELGSWLDDFRLSELWDKNVIGGRPS